MLEIVALVIFFIAHAAGLVLIPLGLPGTFLQVLAAAALALATARISWLWVGVFLGMALAGELIDLLAGQWGAQRFGGSKSAAWGALLGGLAGALVGGIPIPLIGNIIMAFAGTFAGALLGEMRHQKKLTPDLRVGLGAILGRAVGVAAKLSLGIIILIISVFVTLVK